MSGAPRAACALAVKNDVAGLDRSRITRYSRPAAPPRTTYRAANGDVLHATGHVLNGAPDAAGNVSFSGALHITGGTGRFLNASGSAAAAGGFNLNDLTGHYDLTGSFAR